MEPGRVWAFLGIYGKQVRHILLACISCMFFACISHILFARISHTVCMFFTYCLTVFYMYICSNTVAKNEETPAAKEFLD